MINMISNNIKYLRKKKGMTQEELAAELNVSRQSVAKWENGETLPDVYNCMEIAKIFDISIDNLISFSFENGDASEESEMGKYAFGIVKVGERGQIVIPKEARQVFGIMPGDRVIVLGDKRKGGIALVKIKDFEDF